MKLLIILIKLRLINYLFQNILIFPCFVSDLICIYYSFYLNDEWLPDRVSLLADARRSKITVRIRTPRDQTTMHVKSLTLIDSLPKQLRQPLAPPSLVTATDSTPPLALSSHQFHSELKTFLFEQSFPP